MSASGPSAFPPPSLHTSFTFYDLSSAGDDVWAVGRAPGGVRLAASSNGGPWEFGPGLGEHDAPELSAVHATAADDVWIVGHEHDDASASDRTHIAHRDATAWRRVASPNVAGSSNVLLGVDAWGADDACAVGGSTDYPPSSMPFGDPPLAAQSTLVLRWDGANWTTAANPGGGTLYDVCAIDRGTYWAVGTAPPAGPARGGAIVPLAARYAARGWHVAQVPAEGPLFGVAASGPDDVWAVGQDQDPAGLGGPLIVHYDGHAWTAVAAPVGAGQGWLGDIVCAARDDVWAVGIDLPAGGGVGPLILHFDGTSWARVAPPATATSTRLNAVTARAGHGAWAGGFASATPGDNGYALSPPTTRDAGN